ncbi:putative uncharacterized protein DDB_G0291608 [Musca vetustissima]|uniref:putative uncharacterized protein DDB_G0291608 n=1 Tax=Musca vetustissima TaxID=27455 RepID=UPI002AB6BBDF|nr:putative uncharacterized protein DDB_G0291608 [Musca vetustissima]
MQNFNICFILVIIVQFVISTRGQDKFFDPSPVCGSLFDLTKTFSNLLEFSEEYENSGKAWKLLQSGPCPPTTECNEYAPICAVSPKYGYQTFLNQCSMESDRQLSGKDWSKAYPGVCSEFLTYDTETITTPPYQAQIDAILDDTQNMLSVASAKVILKYVSTLRKSEKNRGTDTNKENLNTNKDSLTESKESQSSSKSTTKCGPTTAHRLNEPLNPSLNQTNSAHGYSPNLSASQSKSSFNPKLSNYLPTTSQTGHIAEHFYATNLEDILSNKGQIPLPPEFLKQISKLYKTKWPRRRTSKTKRYSALENKSQNRQTSYKEEPETCSLETTSPQPYPEYDTPETNPYRAPESVHNPENINNDADTPRSQSGHPVTANSTDTTTENNLNRTPENVQGSVNVSDDYPVPQETSQEYETPKYVTPETNHYKAPQSAHHPLTAYSAYETPENTHNRTVGNVQTSVKANEGDQVSQDRQQLKTSQEYETPRYDTPETNHYKAPDSSQNPENVKVDEDTPSPSRQPLTTNSAYEPSESNHYRTPENALNSGNLNDQKPGNRLPQRLYLVYETPRTNQYGTPQCIHNHDSPAPQSRQQLKAYPAYETPRYDTPENNRYKAPENVQNPVYEEENDTTQLWPQIRQVLTTLGFIKPGGQTEPKLQSTTTEYTVSQSFGETSLPWHEEIAKPYKWNSHYHTHDPRGYGSVLTSANYYPQNGNSPQLQPNKNNAHDNSYTISYYDPNTVSYPDYVKPLEAALHSELMDFLENF